MSIAMESNPNPVEETTRERMVRESLAKIVRCDEEIEKLRAANELLWTRMKRGRICFADAAAEVGRNQLWIMDLEQQRDFEAEYVGYHSESEAA